MRTNVVLDDGLVQEAMELTGARTKRELVHLALSTLIERRKRKNLLDLAGELDFAPGFAHEALLLHRDRDFSTIVTVRPLRERWLDL